MCSYVAPTYNSVNITLGESNDCSSDTCTYGGSGNWAINCADNCTLTTNVNLGRNNLTINGTGRFVLNANITNYNSMWITGTSSTNQCSVYCFGGNCFGR
jgi:hypothetical protein